MPLRTLDGLETVFGCVLEFHHDLRTAVKQDEDQMVLIKAIG
jgi:hypothetical protein